MAPDQTSPIRLAIVNDYEIVVAGVAAMLAPHQDQVTVVEMDSGMPVMSNVDVILYDTFGQVQGDGVDLEDLVHGSGAKVVIFSWNVQPELVSRAVARGAAGYLSKGIGAKEIVDAWCACTTVRSSYPPRRSVRTGAPACGRAASGV